MLNIVQISDLHFGREDRLAMQIGLETINHLNPNLILVAGDLTQRAKKSEFLKCKAYLESFRAPKLIVPGNHDIPLYDLFLRFKRPFQNFQAYIQPDLGFYYSDDFCNILGMNSVYPKHYKNGKISAEDTQKAFAIFQESFGKKQNIIVAHHPIDYLNRIYDPENFEKLLAVTDIWLSGHTHRFGYSEVPGPKRYYASSKFFSLKSAHTTKECFTGTFISFRQRGEENSFNQYIIQKNKPIHLKSYRFNRAQRKFFVVQDFDLK